MAKTILITGASGLIGKSLVPILLEQGNNIHILTTQRKKRNLNAATKVFYWDPISHQIDLQSLEGVETIINLAGAPIAQRWTKAAKNRITKSRVKSLELLAHSVKIHNFPVKHLITASAIGIYSNSLTDYYNEKDAHYNSHSFLSSVVQKWEAAARSFDADTVKITILRIGIVLDLSGGALPKIILPIKSYFGAALGSGDQWQSWIHVNDLIGIFSHVLKNNLAGVYNAVAPNPVQQSELTASIARILRKPLFIPNIPQSLLKLILGDMSAIVLESQRVCANKIQQTGFEFQFHEISSALKNLFRAAN